MHGVAQVFLSGQSDSFAVFAPDLFGCAFEMSGHARGARYAARLFSRYSTGSGPTPRASAGGRQSAAPGTGSARVQARRINRSLVRTLRTRAGPAGRGLLQPRATSAMLDLFLHAWDEYDDT